MWPFNRREDDVETQAAFAIAASLANEPDAWSIDKSLLGFGSRYRHVDGRKIAVHTDRIHYYTVYIGDDSGTSEITGRAQRAVSKALSAWHRRLHRANLQRLCSASERDAQDVSRDSKQP